MRIDRSKKQQANGLKMFEAEDIRRMLADATRPMKAMILLGLNGAFGAADLAALPRTAINANWLTFARVKTGIDRRIPLWSETVEAIAEVGSIDRCRKTKRTRAGVHYQVWPSMGADSAFRRKQRRQGLRCLQQAFAVA